MKCVTAIPMLRVLFYYKNQRLYENIGMFHCITEGDYNQICTNIAWDDPLFCGVFFVGGGGRSLFSEVGINLSFAPFQFVLL